MNHCAGCTVYDDGLRDPIRGACPGVSLEYADVLQAIQRWELPDKLMLKGDLSNMITLAFHEEESKRQFACKHARATESTYEPGLVTWYCPECHLTQKRSHFRERGGR